MLITRSDRSNLALWWWNVDRLLLTSFLILIIFGIFLIMASSQHLAENLNISSHHFTLRHIFFGILSVPVIIFFSVLSERHIKIISIVGFIYQFAFYFLFFLKEKKLKAPKDGYI
jgi:cell division protein FtsW